MIKHIYTAFDCFKIKDFAFNEQVLKAFIALAVFFFPSLRLSFAICFPSLRNFKIHKASSRLTSSRFYLFGKLNNNTRKKTLSMFHECEVKKCFCLFM